MSSERHADEQPKLNVPVSQRDDSKPDNTNNVTPVTYIDHRYYNNQEHADTPLMNRMKRMYSAVCLTRKCCEFAGFSYDEISERIHEEMPQYPAKHSDIISNSKLFLVGVADFARSFRNITELSAQTRASLVDANLQLLQCLDGAYTTLKNFPEANAIMTSYTTFLNEDSIDQFFAECPEGLAKEERVKTLRQNIQIIKIVKSQFRKVKPSIDEFMAILGLALWNGYTTSMGAETARIVKINRRGILVELHSVYSRSGITRYESRMAEVLGLLAHVFRELQKPERMT